MKIFRPIQTNIKTQGFGENKACIKPTTNEVYGKPNEETCRTGYEPLYVSMGLFGHNGEDWMAWRGEPLYFPVLFPDVKWWNDNHIDNAGGKGMDIISKNPVELTIKGEIYRGYIKFRFWHLLDFKIEDRSEVKFGQLMGLCDSTGLSSGDHVHWSFKKCKQNGDGLDTDNGYRGALDFNSWFTNKFVLNYLAEELKIKLELMQVQLTLIQILNKYIFLLKEELRKLGQKVGGIFK